MKKENEKKDRSVIGAVASTFTIRWLIQTIAAWAFSQWLTKKWKEWKAKKEDK